MMRFSTLNIAPQPLVGPGLFAADHLSTGDKRCLAVDDVEDVRLFFVDFHLAWSGSARAGNGEVVALCQCAAFRKSDRDFFIVDVSNRSRVACKQRSRE